MANQDQLYQGREQTLVKHLILRRYLERFAHIIGQRWDSITYVDCFAGPWETRSESFADSSFGIAIRELQKARRTLAARPLDRTLRLRCFFLENNRKAYQKLSALPGTYPDVEIETQNAKLENSIEEIVRFVEADQDTFPFILIDPTGWNGFALDVIQPLLQLNPGEVLINFMIEHIRRFLDSPVEETRDSFTRLYGSDAFRQRLTSIPPEDRDDEAVREYVRVVKRAGDFDLSSLAVVLHPNDNRRFFYLPYLTRHPKGVEVFKDAEKRSMPEMEQLRASAKQRSRTGRTRQRELFEAHEVHNPDYFETLRQGYVDAACEDVELLLDQNPVTTYDEAWARALQWPLVWETDLRDWITDWEQSGTLVVGGRRPRQRVLKRGGGIVLRKKPPH